MSPVWPRAFQAVSQTIKVMAILDPQQQYYIGYWAGEGGAQLLYAPGSRSICAWGVQADAEDFGLRMRTPLQIVAVSGALLLGRNEEVLLNPSATS
jgi:hypothetical protein